MGNKKIFAQNDTSQHREVPFQTQNAISQLCEVPFQTQNAISQLCEGKNRKSQIEYLNKI